MKQVQFTWFQSLINMHTVLAALLVASAFTAGTALHLPKYIRPCARSDPKFNDCVRVHAQETLASPILEKGDRQYNVPALNPLLIQEIDVSHGTGLTLKMKDVEIFGLLGASVEKMNVNFDAERVEGKLRFPSVRLIGKYEAEGRILVLPLTGRGDMNITLVNVTLLADLDIGVQPIGSTKHLVLKDVRASVQTSRAYIHLKNLLSNDTVVETAMNEFLNTSWQEVFDMLSPSITKAIVTELGAIFNRIVAVVPFDEVFPETLP